MTDIDKTKATIATLQRQLAEAQAKLEEQQAPNPGPPKDGRIWLMPSDDSLVMWVQGNKNVVIKPTNCLVGSLPASSMFKGERAYTVPLSDLRALVEAHDPANGEAPPSYADLLYAWRR